MLNRKLGTTDIFLRGAKSPLYQERWKKAGIDPKAIRSLSDLQRIPYTDSADLRQIQEQVHPDDLISGGRRPRFWYSTSGSTGIPKWIPIDQNDIDQLKEPGLRLYFVREKFFPAEEIMFSITAPAPFISDSFHWRGLLDQFRKDYPPGYNPIESMVFSFEESQMGLEMAIKRKARVFFAFPGLVMRIAEGITENAKILTKERLGKKISLANLLAYLMTRIIKIKAKYLLKIHTGFFAGEPLEPYRQALKNAWGMKDIYNLYTFSELQIIFIDCHYHNGLHVWMDLTVPEIIYAVDLERERNEPEFIPPAHPLWEASAGAEGELVLTTFGSAFPLIRWRTSDLIKVVSADPCKCGWTHPRVEFLQRSDDLVNLGIIRFSIFTLKKILDDIKLPSSLYRWQLRVTRKGYKPLLKILVRPEKKVDPAELSTAILEAISQMEVLRLGWENGLILKPEIQIIEDLGDRQSSSGKLRPLVYEKDESNV
jgi:phenylacetate-CoA ligase